ncbi:hypothetical protein BDB01DRAFT_779669 [Pilobolus umbonatus]|nr:hypothetical protein BDB01DRAFT_779669 [Pilobolus umbonatus]
MSTRYERGADKELNAKHTKILLDLLQLPDNRFCADCCRKDPRWASWNLGIFICIQCSGTHRSMGTHISKVKSVDLDIWTPDQIEAMVKGGNLAAKVYWEAELKEKSFSVYTYMDQWIKEKYVQKKWVAIDKSSLNSDDNVEKEPTEELENEPQNESRDENTLEVELETPITTNRLSFEDEPKLPSHNSPSVSSLPATSVKSNDYAYHISAIEYSLNKAKEKINSRPIPEKVSPVSMTELNQSVNNTRNELLSSSNYRYNMNDFHQQLSSLSLGMPSSGFIPRVPTSHSAKTSITSQKPVQSPVYSSIPRETRKKRPQVQQEPISKFPYEAFANMLKK